MFRKSNHKQLTILIDDTDTESAEDQFNTELESLIEKFTKSSSTQDNEEQRRYCQALFDKKNSCLTEMFNYMEAANYKSDLSFKYLLQNETLKKIAQPVFFSPDNSADYLEKERNLQTEYSILKHITGTQAHKENQINIPKLIKRTQNRYGDILPFKFNSASYEPINFQNETEIEQRYINASFIDGPFLTDEKMFIAAQGPMTSTINKFYSLCFYQDVKLIIMLCPFEEVGRKKCENYLPAEINQVISLEENLEIAMTSQEWLVENSLIKREVYIRKNGEIKRIIHLQAIDWPDYSKPDTNTGYALISKLIQSIGEAREKYQNSPVLVHCSAGTGRTGTLISIFNLVKCLSYYNAFNFDKDILPFFSVFNTVRKLREQRTGMVASFEQYSFIYEYIQSWIIKNTSGIR
ncbi:MAG: tyrosine-protein phosphatase [archaeon]|nr:tyrosine-protein phosphatase [archaeon]